MANFIPVLSFGSDPELIVTFDTPPEGDPQNETLATEKEQVRSVGGQLFTSDFYDYKTFTLRFILQSNSVALKLKRVFEDYALKGKSFTYFPHSDDTSIRFGVELESESVNFKRDHPDGMGGFLWSFEFTMVNVNKTAPRITRKGRTPTPVPVAPDPVLNLRVTEIEETTLDIAWAEPISTGSSQIKHYEVSIKQGNSAAVVSTTTSLTHQFTGLVANTAYAITVASVNDDDLKSSVETLTVTTARAPLSPPTAVRNFAASEITTTGAKFTWDAPTSSGSTALAFYELSFAKVGEEATLEDIVDARTEDNESIVDEFEANTQYDATIFARNSNVHPDPTKENRDGPTTTIRFRTLVAIVAPTAVRNLVASNVGEETATLRWDAPESTGGGTATISKYQVKVSGAQDSTAVDVTSGTSHNLTGLTARTQYTYQVRAVNSSNLNSPWSSVTFTTETARLVPPAPVLSRTEFIRMFARSHWLYLIFNWPRVGAVPFLDIDNFKIYYRKKGSTEGWTDRDLAPADITTSGARTNIRTRSGVVWPDDNEEPDQIYEFQMTAINPAGESPRSNTVEGTRLQMVESLFEGTKIRKRNFYPNSIVSVGDYYITSDFGKRDKDMDMFSEEQTTVFVPGGGPVLATRERGIVIPDFLIRRIHAMQPSSTDVDKLAIAFRGFRHSTNTEADYLIEVTATYDETTKRWTFTHNSNDVIETSSQVQGLTSFVTRVSYGGAAPITVNRYMYVLWESRYIRMTNELNTQNQTSLFKDVEILSVLRHQGASASHRLYDNSALASYGNKFWVVDFYDETAYAYKLKERTRTTPDVLIKDVARVSYNAQGRVTSILGGPRLDYSYPNSAWARKSFIFFTGSSALKLGQHNQDKVYAYSTFDTQNFGGNRNQFSSPIRIPQLEFTIDDRTEAVRLAQNTFYTAIFVWKNRMFINCRTDTVHGIPGEGSPINSRVMAFKL